MRAIYGGLVVCALIGCGSREGGDGDDDPVEPDVTDCVGLECQIVPCAKSGKPPTSLTGTVYAPNGALPLFGVNVYVPRDLPLPAFPDGAQCSRCNKELPGSPLASVQTDDAGHFRLEDVPAGQDIPLVITTGKWRRQITIPRIEPCAATAVADADTRLPRNKGEGDIPKIAITTGEWDTLECLVRKLGIDDAEIGKQGEARRIHLYEGNGVYQFESGFPGGSGDLTSATPLWSSSANLRAYDMVFLSCEGAQNGATKPQAALDAMKEYADQGGRVFASHWHNIWIAGQFQDPDQMQKPRVWDTLGTWFDGDAFDGPVQIDETAHSKGISFASWMKNVGASTTRGVFDVAEGRTTSVTLDPARTERWVYQQTAMKNAQMFQFTTPLEAPTAERCGKVVFTDMHVSGKPVSLDPYPTHCIGGTTLTPQEKALAFMFFDIASCVGPIL
ncbi:MAG TPA: carboxypeptidase-like regulatory domain-containing protein [Kofleriaceae bacterium]|nr:carboxypeptidase-like regulatory domain-containing protein [Kofleriaceae bacterium]